MMAKTVAFLLYFTLQVQCGMINYMLNLVWIQEKELEGKLQDLCVPSICDSICQRNFTGRVHYYNCTVN